mgnify:CR=1
MPSQEMYERRMNKLKQQNVELVDEVVKVGNCIPRSLSFPPFQENVLVSVSPRVSAQIASIFQRNLTTPGDDCSPTDSTKSAPGSGGGSGLPREDATAGGRVAVLSAARVPADPD